MSLRNIPSTAGKYWKQMVINGSGSGRRGFAYNAPNSSSMENTAHLHHHHHGDEVPKKITSWSSKMKGEYAPVFVALGLIIMSTTFGLHTAMQQLGRAPNVSVRKSRRETIPEVTEPERVLEDADKFMKKSFFRKVAHVQDYDRQDQVLDRDPIRPDVLARNPRAQTLKDVGVVDPKPNPSHE
ncbi:uncharacterized protein LOC124916759 [Impatiens glandulifera]|uniref:uncharacterized protein LOC124916759 n=1 Tax=Impatiens glandulifera TaxID=253017 RepID=UPI001FB08E6D|nr:uncharacterized protein LOC124916759 [Impatiens glandulifera]